ncbi:MAG TPA: bifunctional 3,4-dihydroxy-2-butanone-4-phosphate synthase/GTP cyclohydrolase II [Kiritimatiellia bacterium]|nr:bifunctional 3,4-dihydroxy-2-butanone-4-phosphate synthase/GTP cyclohydrolase II [Kiritimatiellia bacterium]HMO97963.1 bifunctional 3,4-dihydroxy-2-butanone-4-phosphate synthase/GTP cyclohydrolase II [Kiritimatiellia bacterium]HMP95314.1 bifunctional 3,4-dihydroxy-2-butanone-4-phosphate synthase/GTP cyclohydrolase II [Kiritimatiellia bacterium]
MQATQPLNKRAEFKGFERLEKAIEAFRQGRIVIVTDDARRENEGDLIVAAEKITPEAINFMTLHGRGLICIAMDSHRLCRLGLSRMMSHGDGDHYRTAFMESVDARDGITTGISAFDRARTVEVLMDDRSTAADLIRPGHMFPLEAVSGGVLRRPGHTEAAVDLCHLAGLKPGGVICEVLNADGTMARMPDLQVLAGQHDIPMLTIQDLIQYRSLREKLIELDTQINLPTEFGLFKLSMYRSLIDQKTHLALVLGNPAEHEAPLVRIHSECLTGDAFGSLRCDCGSQLHEAMQMIGREGHGVLLYMRQEGRGIGLEFKIRAYALQEQGLDTVEANEQLGFEADERDYTIASQMLLDLGVKRVRLITNNPRKIDGLEAFGIGVAERVPLILPGTTFSEHYLDTKKKKLGHLL